MLVGMWKGHHFSMDVIQKGTFSAKKWYMKGAVLRDIHLPSGVRKSKTRNEAENYLRCVRNNNIFIALRV